MPGGAGAGGRHPVLVGIGLEKVDQVLGVVHRQLRIDREQRRADHEPPDRREVLERIERDLLDVRQQGERARRAIDEGVAVGGGLQPVDQAGLAEFVDHFDRLAERLAEPLRHDPRQEIGRRSHHLRRHQPDRPIGIIRLGVRRRDRSSGHDDRQCGDRTSKQHDLPPTTARARRLSSHRCAGTLTSCQHLHVVCLAGQPPAEKTLTRCGTRRHGAAGTHRTIRFPR